MCGYAGRGQSILGDGARPWRDPRRSAAARPARARSSISALYSGISRGTEAIVFGGRVPPSEWDRMRAPFQQGRLSVAREVRLFDGRPRRTRSRRTHRPHVFVLHPHQTRFIVPAADVHVLLDGIDSRGARCWPPISRRRSTECGTARPHVGDRIAVIGAGTVGCLAAWLLSGIPGCDVELIDINPRRAAVAQALGGADSRNRPARPEEQTSSSMRAARPERPRTGAAGGGRRGEDRRAELVRRSDRAAVPWRRIPCQTPDDRVLAGRPHVAPSQRPRWDSRRRMQLVLGSAARSAARRPHFGRERHSRRCRT